MICRLWSRSIRFDLWINRNSFISDVSNISIVMISCVLYVLSATIRKSNRVRSCNKTISIRGLSSIEVCFGVIISYSILVSIRFRGLLFFDIRGWLVSRGRGMVGGSSLDNWGNFNYWSFICRCSNYWSMICRDRGNFDNWCWCMISRGSNNWCMVHRGCFNNWCMIGRSSNNRCMIGRSSFNNWSVVDRGRFNNWSMVGRGCFNNRGMVDWSSYLHNWGSMVHWSRFWMIDRSWSISFLQWESSRSNSSSSRFLIAPIAMHRLRSSMGLAHYRCMYSSMGLVN